MTPDGPAPDDRSAGELAEHGARALLEKGTVAHLAYVGLDGTPRVVPVGFLWTGDALVVSTAATAPKAAAIAANPDVAVNVDSRGGPGPERAVSIRGRASVEVVDGVTPEYLTSAAKSMSGEELAAFEKAVVAMYPQMARIAITPTWARYWDFGAGRLPGFLQELAARQG